MQDGNAGGLRRLSGARLGRIAKREARYETQNLENTNLSESQQNLEDTSGGSVAVGWKNAAGHYCWFEYKLIQTNI
jgi:hypothetical protein